MLTPLGLGRDVGTLPQTLAGNAGASGLEALTSRGLACQCWPALAAGVNIRTSQMYWFRGVSLWRRSLLLHPFSPLYLN